MSIDDTLTRTIGPQQVLEALCAVVQDAGDFVEAPEPTCEWKKLCGENCRFPRYFRDGNPAGLVAHVLLELGYPKDLLKLLDTEYELGEILHPGVKIMRSRNAALFRLERPSRLLLGFLQDHQKLGMSWLDITREATRSRRMIRMLDQRRRPWLY